MKPSELTRLPVTISTPAVGKIRIDFTQGNKKNKNYIFIEGSNNSNDFTVYNKVKTDKCELYPSGTKDKVINETKSYYQNLISIVDRDYDEIEENIPNLFYTDQNDIESTAIYLSNDSYKTVFENIRIDRNSINEKGLEEIYYITLDLSKKISNFNRFLLKYNKKNNTDYNYLLNIYDNNFLRTKMLSDILDKNYNINIRNVLKLYQKWYTDFSISELQLSSVFNEIFDGFRGHDFFIILAYMFQKYNVKVFSLNYDYDKTKYLEKRFIEKFAETKKIKNSVLYENIVSKTTDFFEI